MVRGVSLRFLEIRVGSADDAILIIVVVFVVVGCGMMLSEQDDMSQIFPNPKYAGHFTPTQVCLPHRDRYVSISHVYPILDIN